MIKIFVGTSLQGQGDEAAEITLEHSLFKYSTEPVDVIFMRNEENGFAGKFEHKKWVTPFSGLRWAIPEVCNFEGRAIYMDVDQLNLRDISILHNMDLKNRAFACRPDRLCVMVLDCAKMKEIVRPISMMQKDSNYHNSIYQGMTNKGIHFDKRWNCLDGEGLAISDIWHLHFTKMDTQPWKPNWFKGTHQKHERPDLVQLWEDHRDEAYRSLNAGYI